MSRLLNARWSESASRCVHCRPVRCKQIGVSMAASAQVARQELLRQIAVPMKGGGFAS
jgi:hypothetical protein